METLTVRQTKESKHIAGFLIGWGFISLLFSVSPAYSADLAPKNISLIDSERLAFENHPTIKLANEEVSVTKAKKMEAARALWPAVTLKAEKTIGAANNDLATPEFKEETYGVQASQPLIQGGKLYRTYKQAQSTWQSTRAKRDKAEREVLYNVREAYWQMVRARVAEDVYVRALSDLEKERRRAERLFQKDIITKETYLMIGSQYHQASLAIESAQAEREALLWRWTIALGLQNPPDFEPEATIPINKSTVSLEQCLQTAKLNNPDLRIQRSTTDASRYGYKALKGAYWPQVGVNGFYGRSGGAFKNETFDLREDWQVGVQLSQYFALNTLNVSGFKQKTSPKIGQSSRTESKTGTASLGLLDGFKTRSEIKDSGFSFHQSENQLNQSEIEVLADVREAYANWKKGLTQLSFAGNEVEWKKTEFRIAMIKTAHRDLPISERAKLRNELALAEAALVAAQTNYNILQAALSKVVGVPDLFARQ